MVLDDLRQAADKAEKTMIKCCGTGRLSPRTRGGAARDVERGIACFLEIAREFGLAEIGPINFVGSAMLGQPLTKIEAIRQLITGSSDPAAFAGQLRRLADRLERESALESGNSEGRD